MPQYERNYSSAGSNYYDEDAMFYSDSVETMSEDEIQIGSETVLLKLKHMEIERAVLSGDKARAGELLDEAFLMIEESRPAVPIAKNYCMGLYVCLVRCCSEDKVNNYMQGIVPIYNGKSFSKIKSFIRARTMELVYQKAPDDTNIYSTLVKGTMRIIDDNLGNERLSLRWIAKENLFTNVDYLGKIFKRETGINFSQYVMQKRMELAKEQLGGEKSDRIYEIAERVGYGSNSQYFSQVFKKYTGFSPLEYKEMAIRSFRNA